MIRLIVVIVVIVIIVVIAVAIGRFISSSGICHYQVYHQVHVIKSMNYGLYDVYLLFKHIYIYICIYIYIYAS